MTYDQTAISLLIEENQPHNIALSTSSVQSPTETQTQTQTQTQTKAQGLGQGQSLQEESSIFSATSSTQPPLHPTFSNSQLSALRKPQVTTTDVSLSARSYNEKLLVSLRDDSIRVSQDQITLLTKTNDQLRRSMNEVEAEMITLQQALGEKEGVIRVKNREIEGKNAEL